MGARLAGPPPTPPLTHAVTHTRMLQANRHACIGYAHITSASDRADVQPLGHQSIIVTLANLSSLVLPA